MICLPYEVGVSPTLHIRGMIASSTIRKNRVIEKCPVVRFPIRELPIIQKTILNNFYFDWSDTHAVIVLGYGSLINHSFEPNAAYRWDYKFSRLFIYALRDIQKKEEVFINYNGYPEDKTPLEPAWTIARKY